MSRRSWSSYSMVHWWDFCRSRIPYWYASIRPTAEQQCGSERTCGVWSIYGKSFLILLHNRPATQANSAFHPSGVSKWGPASAGNAKAGMVHSVSGWTRGVQVKLWDPLRMHAIPEHLRGVFMTRQIHIYLYVYLYLLTGLSSLSVWMYSLRHSRIQIIRWNNMRNENIVGFCSNFLNFVCVPNNTIRWIYFSSFCMRITLFNKYHRWRGGAIGTASDLWLMCHGFESCLGTADLFLLYKCYICVYVKRPPFRNSAFVSSLYICYRNVDPPIWYDTDVKLFEIQRVWWVWIMTSQQRWADWLIEDWLMDSMIGYLFVGQMIHWLIDQLIEWWIICLTLISQLIDAQMY